jgi:hypothetical protein
MLTLSKTLLAGVGESVGQSPIEPPNSFSMTGVAQSFSIHIGNADLLRIRCDCATVFSATYKSFAEFGAKKKQMSAGRD